MNYEASLLLYPSQEGAFRFFLVIYFSFYDLLRGILATCVQGNLLVFLFVGLVWFLLLLLLFVLWCVVFWFFWFVEHLLTCIFSLRMNLHQSDHLGCSRYSLHALKSGSIATKICQSSTCAWHLLKLPHNTVT